MTSTPASDRWFCRVGGTKMGPVSTGRLRAMVEGGALTVESLVWRDGMADWMPVGEVPDVLSEGFVATARSASLSAGARRSLSLPMLVFGVAGVVVCAALVGRLFSRGGDDPFSYRRVSGTVLYEDGGVIPAGALTLTFVSTAPPYSPRMHPRPGIASVNPKTGDFQSVTSHKPGDGLVMGSHKVLISGDNRRPLPEDVIPPEYTDFKTTPLQVDTEAGPFLLKVRRPPPAPKQEAGKSPKT
jgi:hypothetical protein